MKTNLQSSVNEVGDIVTQKIHFSWGNIRTFDKVISSSIEQGRFTTFNLESGRTVYVNQKNVDYVIVTSRSPKVMEWETKAIIVHFKGWNKLTMVDCMDMPPKCWEMIKVFDKNWTLVLINIENMDCIERFDN